MSYNVGQDIPDSNSDRSASADDAAIAEADGTNADAARAKVNSMPSWLPDAPPPVPIHPAAVVSSGDCVAVITAINYNRKRDALAAKVHATCKNGGFTDFTLYAPLAKVRRAVHIAMKRRGQRAPAEIGSFLDDIGSAFSGAVNDVAGVAADVVKATGVGDAINAVQGVINNPVFKGALSIGGAIFPPLGVSVSAINAAGNLISKASAGNQAAKQQIAQVMTAGMHDHSEAAVKAATTLSAVFQAKQALNAPAPAMTRMLNQAIQVSLMPNATSSDRQLVQQLFDFFASITQGGQQPMNFPAQGYGQGYAPNQAQPGQYGQPGPYRGQGYAPAPKQFDSGGTHVVISGWPIAKIGAFRKCLVGAGWLYDKNPTAYKLLPFDGIYAAGAALMLKGAGA